MLTTSSEQGRVTLLHVRKGQRWVPSLARSEDWGVNHAAILQESGCTSEGRGPRLQVGRDGAGIQAHLLGGMQGARKVGTTAALSSGASHVTGLPRWSELPAWNPRSKRDHRAPGSLHSLNPAARGIKTTH